MLIQGFTMKYFRCPDVLWNTVGVTAEEALLIKEGETVEMYIVTGKLGSALWSRLDGTRTIDDLALEMADHLGVDKNDARDVVTPFIESLKEQALIQTEPINGSPEELNTIVDWPEIMESPTLSPFDLQTLVSEDMVAFASFAGGRQNVGGGGSCQVGPGGKNNIGGAQPVCHP